MDNAIRRVEQDLAWNDANGCQVLDLPTAAYQGRGLVDIESIRELLAHSSRIASFLDEIISRTPNGEWIAVQYHPDSDWSVAHKPLDRIKDQYHGG